MTTQRTIEWALLGLLAIGFGCAGNAPAPEPPAPSTATPTPSTNGAGQAAPSPAAAATSHEARRPKLAAPAATATADKGPGPSASGRTAPVDEDEWTVMIEPDATLTVRHRGASVVKSTYHFWGENWKYATYRRKVQFGHDRQAVFDGTVPDLGATITGTMRAAGPGAVRVDYDLRLEQTRSSIIGGGLQWALAIDSPSLDGASSDPVLLENKNGWAWPVGPGQKIEVRFDQESPEAYFERNQKSTVRTFLIGDHVEPGRRRFGFTLQLPEGGRFVPSATERYGPVQRELWHRAALEWNAAPVDLSFLNAKDRPAGRRGLVHAEGDRLVFADGSEARFWGTNLAANAVFETPRANVAPQAHRIAQLGHNLVRIHHHDSWSSVFGRKHKDTRHFNGDAMDHLDWWIKCLKDEGIYIWLDMHVMRAVLPADGLHFGAAEIIGKRDNLKGLCYYNEELQGLMKEFQENYLNHVNKYTKLRYKDDPALVGVLITNENDLTLHYGNLLLPDKKNPIHNAVFTKEYQAFAKASGLPPGRVFQTWAPGPGKYYLNDAQHRFDEAMIGHLRSLGLKAPIATTSLWGRLFSFSLPALTAGDIIDVHSYGASEALSANVRYEPNFVTEIGLGQVAGKPVSISEWNMVNRDREVDRFTAPLYVASIAALQGWDAPMIYNYAQVSLASPAGKGDDRWSSFADPALSGIMPAAAIAYRKGHVRPARAHYYLELAPDQFMGQNINATTSATIRTLAEQSRLSLGIPAMKELPWLKPTKAPDGATVLTDLDRDFLPKGQTFVRSDTGELTRDWKAGTLTIDSPKTQSVSGWIGGKTFQLADASFEFKTKKAVVALTSIDDEPLARSRFILITAIARAVVDEQNRLPFFSEPVEGAIQLRNHADGLELLTLAADGAVEERSKPNAGPDGLTVRLPTRRGTHWYLLKAPRKNDEK